MVERPMPVIVGTRLGYPCGDGGANEVVTGAGHR